MTLRRISVALSAAILIVITGCGSSADLSSDVDSSQSSQSSDSVGTGNIAGDLTLASFSSRTSEAQVKAQSAHLEMELSLQGQPMTMSGDMAVGKSLEDAALDLTMSVPGLGERMSMILVDGVMYISAGQATGGKYFSLDLTDESNPFGSMYRQIFEQANPASITQGFEGAIKDLEAVGREEIDGTTTTQYRVTVDTQKVLAKILGKNALPEGSLGAMPPTLTYDIWVGDDDNLPRRIESDMMGISATMELTDWGKPVHVEAPPPSQVSKKDLMAQLPSMPTTPKV
jgi:LppX_LprAFG lipoprotein